MPRAARIARVAATRRPRPHARLLIGDARASDERISAGAKPFHGGRASLARIAGGELQASSQHTDVGQRERAIGERARLERAPIGDAQDIGRGTIRELVACADPLCLEALVA